MAKTQRTKNGLMAAVLGVALLGLSLLAPPAEAGGRHDRPARRGKTHPKLMALARDQATTWSWFRPQNEAMVDVIVRYRSQPGDFEKSRVRFLGSEVKREFENLPMMALRVPRSRLGWLAFDGDVRFVDPDSPIEATSLAAKKTARLPGAGLEWKTLAMPDVGIAVIDSGVADHWDLNVTERRDCTTWIKGCPNLSDSVKVLRSVADTSYDPYGHGTHIAGIIGGTGKGKSPAEAGVAPWAPITSLRVLDGEGHGQASNLIAALDWVLENAADRQIRVVNLSLGTALEESAANDPLVEAVEALWDAGIVVVCSAGNYGRNGNFTITSPGQLAQGDHRRLDHRQRHRR